MAGLGGAELRAAGAVGGMGGGGGGRVRGPVGAVAARLASARGSPVGGGRAHEWLQLTPKDSLPTPKHVAFPKPPKAPGQYFSTEYNINNIFYVTTPNLLVPTYLSLYFRIYDHSSFHLPLLLLPSKTFPLTFSKVRQHLVPAHMLQTAIGDSNKINYDGLCFVIDESHNYEL